MKDEYRDKHLIDLTDPQEPVYDEVPEEAYWWMDLDQDSEAQKEFMKSLETAPF